MDRAAPPRTQVGCWLEMEAAPGTALALKIAVAPGAGDVVSEQVTVSLDGGPVERHELSGPGGERTHVVEVGPGTLRIGYQAEVAPRPVPAAGPAADAGPIAADLGAIEALYPSAYCRSDRLAGFTAVELGALRGGPDVALQVADWVFERIAYRPGSSGPLDAAVDTLLANAGVCRDFAHLTIALLRALGVPARLVAVYAPGLSPMDFHAVVEARTAEGWEIVDATRLAPRSSLVRIATGRDAADTAFVTTLRGNAQLITQQVTAVIDGDLPTDDHTARLVLP